MIDEGLFKYSTSKYKDFSKWFTIIIAHNPISKNKPTNLANSLYPQVEVTSIP